MKILLVTPFLPYPGVPHAGGKLAFHLLSFLAREHSVHLVSRIFPGEEAHLPILGKIVGGLDIVAAKGPLVPGSFLSLARTVASYRHLARKAHEALRRGRFDFCQVEYTETAVFFSPPTNLPSALSLHDVIAKPARRRYEISRGADRVFAWIGWRIRRSLEGRAISRFRLVFTLSDVDREWAERLYPVGRFRVLRYPAGLEFLGLQRREILGRVLFVGALNRTQNMEAVRYIVRHVWPSVRKKCPDAEFRVVGAGMADAFREELERVPGVRAVGFVDRVEDEYMSARVFVAPILEGGGIIVKILDAMAAGVPVVTTPFGNEGIGAASGEEILVADHPERFAEAVALFLVNGAENVRIGEAGRRFVGRFFSPEAFAVVVRSTLRELAGGVDGPSSASPRDDEIPGKET
ncbi:MAG TPA: glycosyltransferase [Thermodesulfobacteriota bacterium]|nr:glycosyltransferase [Thermodesulfobacteriota bacterium]